MNHYKDWGFKKNPFETSALPASDEGDKLLVGRDALSKMLLKRISNPSKITTIEGLNGVGKTSLVNVTVYRAYKKSIKSNVGPLFIPCRKIFQLSDDIDALSFKRMVMLEVCQTLLFYHKELPPPSGHTRVNKKTSIDRFINSAQLKSFSLGAWVLSGGVASETNTGIGFEQSGFEKAVEDWLHELFPNTDSGSVVCILDNLELLQTSHRARETIEELRDILFTMNGVQFVLCGANGIVHGIASSPRMDGRLQKPIFVDDLSEDFASEVFQRRVRAFRESVHAKLPLSEANFVELFDIMRGNIRATLSECDEFCMWVADQVEDREDFREELFEFWLDQELETAYSAVQAALRPRALKAFSTACQFEVFSPSDCLEFGYATPEAMRPQIKVLEEVGLLVSSIDEFDKRRKTIQVTSKGWKVRAFLDYFDEGHDMDFEGSEPDEEEEDY